MESQEEEGADGPPLIDVRDVLPMTEFIRQSKSFLTRMRRDNRPLLITSAGRPAMVVMTPERYEAMGQGPRSVSQESVNAKARSEHAQDR